MRHAWRALSQWRTAAEVVDHAEDLRDLGQALRREDRADRLLDLATVAASYDQDLGDEDLAQLFAARLISQSQADIAALVVPTGGDDASEEPVIITKGTLRAVARLHGDEALEHKNRLTDGRLAVARVIGYGRDSRRAHLALMELSNRICLPEPDQECTICPVEAFCASSRKSEQANQMLPGLANLSIKTEG
jgi:DNA (cytosine-5)-methyltransferase 1